VIGVRLRTSVPSDIPYLVEIFVAAFQRGYPALLPADVLAGVDGPTVTGWFARWASTDRLDTVVADVDGTPRGFIRFGDDPSDDDTAVGYVAALYVHPDAAGAGLGRRLLDHAVRQFAGQHRVAVRLWVFQGNERARGLYSSAGFVPDGRELTDPQWRVPQIRLRKELVHA
jgi:GNAT superfamily N-acetyltransferase